MNPHPPSPNRSAIGEALRAQIEEAWMQRHDTGLPLQLARDNPDLADELLDFFDRLVSLTIAPTPTDEQEEEAAKLLQARLRQTGLSHLADAIERVRSSGAPDPSDAPDEPGSDSSSEPPLTLVPPPTASDLSKQHAHRTGPADSQWTEACEDYYDYADRFGYGPGEISAAFGLPIATTHELILHSEECPLRAQEEMARRGADHLEGTDYHEGLWYLSGQQRVGKKEVQRAPRYQQAASRTSGYSDSTGFSYKETIRNAPSSFPEEERAFWLALADDLPRQ